MYYNYVTVSVDAITYNDTFGDAPSVINYLARAVLFQHATNCRVGANTASTTTVTTTQRGPVSFDPAAAMPRSKIGRNRISDRH